MQAELIQRARRAMQAEAIHLLSADEHRAFVEAIEAADDVEHLPAKWRDVLLAAEAELRGWSEGRQ